MDSSLHRICKHCTAIFEHAARLLTSESDDGNISDDVATALTAEHHSLLVANINAKSCHMCSLISHIFPRVLDPFDPKGTPQWLMWGDKDEQYLDLGFHISKHDFIQDLRIQTRNEAAVSLHNTSSIWSYDALKIVQTWMRDCTSTANKTHTQCARPRAKKQLPLRLVDVMSHLPGHTNAAHEMTRDEFESINVDAPPPAQIISTESFPLTIRYMTLSHRWGNSPSIILNSNTAPTLLSGNIPLDLLGSPNAKLFRHAMYVARCLGIRYLWIDCMCIMQDDDAEKAREIALMGEIYHNSSLNISATDSTSGADGLIFPRDALKTVPCQVSIHIPGSKPTTLDLVAFHNKIAVESDEGELNRRGWVMQERMLSPRVLHFTREQIFWECNSLLASEIRHEGESIDPTDTSDVRGILSASDPAPLPADTMTALWYHVVRQYSATSLSFFGDRLLAVSALAERFSIIAGQPPDSYVAGLWTSHLPLALVWRRIPNADAASASDQDTAKEKMAPTWSWARLACAVEFAEMRNLHANINVLSVGVHPRSDNPFDGATGHIRLRGQMCKLEKDPEAQGGLEITWDVSEAPPKGIALFLLYVADRHSDGRRDMRGLVLQRTGDKGRYTRLGAFSTDNFEIEGSYIQAALTGATQNLVEDDALEPYQRQGYTIEIV